MKRKTFVVILLMVIWIGGCGVDAGQETRAVKDTILRYNELLTEGYAKMDMTLLQKAATQEQAQKVYTHMAALGEAKIRMESQLVDIAFVDIQLPEQNLARAKTRERWNYAHMRIDTELPGEAVMEGLIYKLSYELVRKDDRWFVSSVSILEEDKPEPQ